MPLFPIIWSLWLLSEIFLNGLLRSGNRDKKNKDKGTFRILWITIGLSITTGIIAGSLIRIPISNSLVIPLLGLALIVFGMIIRFISIGSLGRLFTVDVTIRDNHRIIKDGIYRIIRHPSYSGSLLSFIGLGLSLNNWLSLVLIFIPVAMAMSYRIRIEERMLCEEFGSEYTEYIKRTFRLIPGIY